MVLALMVCGYDNRKVSDIGFTWTTNNGDAVNTTTDNDEIMVIKNRYW
jgi:hypothetical protein